MRQIVGAFSLGSRAKMSSCCGTTIGVSGCRCKLLNEVTNAVSSELCDGAL